MKYFKKDREYFESRRRFLRNTSILAGILGLKPAVKMDLLSSVSKKLGMNSLSAMESFVDAPRITFELCFRAGFNMRCLMPPARAMTEQSSEMRNKMNVWARNTHSGNPHANVQIEQSSLSNSVFANAGDIYDNLKDLPLAHFWYRFGDVVERDPSSANPHRENFSLRMGSAQNGPNANSPSSMPCFSALHRATIARQSVDPRIVVAQLNENLGEEPSYPIWHNRGETKIENVNGAIGSQYKEIGSNDFQTLEYADLSLATFSGQLSTGVFGLRNAISSGFTNNEKAILADSLDHFAEMQLGRLKIQNSAHILKTTEASWKVLEDAVLSDVLTLSPAEQEAFDVQNLTSSRPSGEFFKPYNLGLWMGTFLKAAELGLAQNFIIEVDWNDQHPLESGQNWNNGGWQEEQFQRARNLAKVLRGFHDYGINRQSPYSDRSLFEDSAVLLSSDLGRTPDTGLTAPGGGDGAFTDYFHGSSIFLSPRVKQGTYFDHSSNHESHLYPNSIQAGSQLQLVSSDENLLSGEEAWNMLAAGFVGNSIANQFVSGSTRKPRFIYKP